MRLHIQRQMMDLIGTVQEGINYLPKADAAYKPVLTADCRQAIEVFTATLRSQLSGEGYSKYEEALAVLQPILALDIIGEDELQQAIQRLDALWQTLKYETEVKLEIVFMPYKYSMWDSLESIWLAAKCDPGCNCYVVPIPYFEKKADGTDRKLCYEGDLFPESTAVVSYLQYAVEKHQPDVIYIHNPYDEYNLVTSVAPEYYSSNLKQYTSCLVYVPYFLAGPYSSVATAETSCIVPGAQNADVVIAQSKEHKKAFAACGIDAGKVLALGSPKTDKVITLEKDPAPVPESWVEACAGKKVFTYISGLTDLLQKPEQLELIDQNIKRLLEGGNAAVIWRPHPLMLPTIRSMRPEQAQAIRQLLEELSAMPNVILDENDNAYPAMQLCDAMVSEYSSVMFQFGLTGKPVLSLRGNTNLFRSGNIAFLPLNYYGFYFIAPWEKDPGITLSEFRDMVLRGDDPKKEERLRLLRSSLANSDGSCGKRIHETMMQIFTK